jgi:hypothetical protein
VLQDTRRLARSTREGSPDACLRHSYHTGLAGVTGGPGAVDRLLRYLLANDDWHHLDPPEMDEALERHVKRAILRHPAVIAVTDYGRLEPLTALGRVRPAIVTLPRWEDGLAEDEAVDRKLMSETVQLDFGATHTAASAFRPRIVRRLWVEFFAQIAAENWLMHGRFADDPEYQPRLVNPDLLRNPAMWLDPRGGRFRPDETGKGPDIDCLILREAVEAKQAKTPRQITAEPNRSVAALDPTSADEQLAHSAAAKRAAWEALVKPAGEPLQAVLDRAMREAVTALDRAVREAVAAREPRLPAPPLPPVTPLSAPLRDWTVAIWERDWGPPWPNGERESPDDRFFPDDHRKAFEYRVERDARRAVIDVLDQWTKRGELELWNRRPDGALELVPLHLRCSRFMMLHAHTGQFVPVAWQGQAPPADLRRYSEITVRSVERRSPLLPAADLPTQTWWPLLRVEAAEPLLSPDPEWIDLTGEPPSLLRFSAKALAAAKLHVARTDEIDACIQKLAELDGGQTDRPTIRRWGRYWLRQYRQADTLQDTVVKRFEELVHEQRRRPEGNPQFRE